MSFDYTVERLPAAWPGKATKDWDRKRSNFKIIWTRTLNVLARELRHLDGTNVKFALDVTDYDIRADGQMRANARLGSPGVIVSFDTPDRGRLAFPCDTFTFWQANIHAIARALEALRLVDRYGVQQGAQYTGFKAIPPTTRPTMDAARAAELVSAVVGGGAVLLRNPDMARDAVRRARAMAHPDAGGSIERWHEVEEARAVLSAHFGATL